MGSEGQFNFASRSDSMSIGAEETVQVDTVHEDDDDDPRPGGQGKRRRIESFSDEEIGAGAGDDEDSATGNVINNNEEPDPLDEEETRHPQGSRNSPVYMCARKIAQDKFQCNICKFELSCKHSSTSTVFNHMSRCHPKDPKVIEMLKILDERREEREKAQKEREAKAKDEGRQASMMSFVKGGKPVDRVRKKRIYGKLVDFLVSDNQSFSMVENFYFRELMFELEPGLIVPSRQTATRQLDERAADAREKLKDEILNDLKKAGHTSVTITSDHGTSRDNNRTRKNVLTLSRTCDDFSVKCDTVDLIICEESQTGAVIRASVKDSLVKWAGFDKDTMTVNWVTDNEAKQVNARNPNYHQDSGLPIHFEGGCVDHLLELALSEALKNCFEMDQSVKAAHDIVNYMKESSLARLKLAEICENLGLKPLSIVKGTLNRWFAKYFEINCFLDLEQALKEFQGNDLPASLSQVNYEDWGNLRVYVLSQKPIVDSATMLESETSCTSSSVIPFIFTVLDELEALKAACRNDAHKRFYSELISQLKRRFPNGFKTTQPYNALTLLDPRHLDTYFCREEKEEAKNVILYDMVYEEDRRNVGQTAPVDAPSPPNRDKPVQSRVQSLRDKLLRQRFIETQVVARREDSSSFEDKIGKELDEFLSLVTKGMPDIDTDPSTWYKDNHKKFPLLSKFWKAYSSFPATSSASERVFNVDGLVISLRR